MMKTQDMTRQWVSRNDINAFAQFLWDKQDEHSELALAGSVILALLNQPPVRGISMDEVIAAQTLLKG